MGDGWGWMFSGGLIMLVFWGGLIALIVLAVRGLGGGTTAVRSNAGDGAHSAVTPAPLEILQARYARGEVTKEQYEAIRRDLQTS
jgi:putative membrane protein